MAPFARIVTGRHRDRFRNRQAAMADVQIDRGVKLGIVEFEQDIGTNDPDLRSAMGDEGRDVERADPNDADIVAIGGETQRTALFICKGRFGHDPGARKKRQRLFENAPLGNCDDDRIGHGGRALPGRAQSGNLQGDVSRLKAALQYSIGWQHL